MTKRGEKSPPSLSTDEINLLRRHIALSRDVLERFARQSEDSAGLQARARVFEEIIREWLSELAERIERIERLLLIERIGGDASGLRAGIKADLDSTKTLLLKHVRNLGLLQMQAADYGLSPPLHLLNEIANEQELIQNLQERLHDEQR